MSEFPEVASEVEPAPSSAPQGRWSKPTLSLKELLIIVVLCSVSMALFNHFILRPIPLHLTVETNEGSRKMVLTCRSTCILRPE